jgi:hypothetical protein
MDKQKLKLIQDALDWIIPMLIEEGIPFHITGGFAAHLYGAQREINDIDIDLPTEDIERLMSRISQFIDYPAQRHRDSTWDLFVCTLDYQGQLIDLSGAEDAYVSNKSTGSWDPLVINFNDVVNIEAFGHQLPIQNPRDLMSYKSKIKYDEAKHLSDIQAIERYLAELMKKSSF